MVLKKFQLFFILCIALLLSPVISAAETMEYSVKANIPENQIDKDKTYFDLKVSPNQEQDISITVTNSGSKEAKLIIEPNVATTNQNGLIDYSQKKVKKDSTLKIPLTSVISGKQEVVLQPNEKKDVVFKLKMPSEEYQGVILGGFYIYKDSDNSEEKENEEVQIKNKYSYVIGIKLTENETTIEPNLKINKIQPGLQNYRTVVTVNIQNTAKTIINNLDVNAEVTKKGSKEVLYASNKEKMSMAPNSNFDYPIDWKNQKLEPGKYTAHIRAKSDDHSWKFNKDFEIKADNAKPLNKEAVNLEQSKNYAWVYIVIGLFFILAIGTIVYLLYKQKNTNNEE